MNRPLDGLRLLVVEDDFLMATELAAALVAAGAAIVGLCPTVVDALELIRFESIDGAVLDCVLPHGDATPLADALSRRGIPFVFATGVETTFVPPAYATVPVLQKPTDLPDLIDALANGACAGRSPVPVRVGAGLGAQLR